MHFVKKVCTSDMPIGEHFVKSHLGVIITGSFSTKSRIISNEALPEPTIIPALRQVKLKFPFSSSSSTVFLERRCLDKLDSLTIPLKYITCLTLVLESLSRKLMADCCSNDL